MKINRLWQFSSHARAITKLYPLLSPTIPSREQGLLAREDWERVVATKLNETPAKGNINDQVGKIDNRVEAVQV